MVISLFPFQLAYKFMFFLYFTCIGWFHQKIVTKSADEAYSC